MRYYKYCLRCGRRLKTEEARLIGYGKTCQQKAKEHARKIPLIKISKKC